MKTPSAPRRRTAAATETPKPALPTRAFQDSFAALLQRIALGMRADLELALKSLELTMAHYIVLATVADDGPRTQGNLGDCIKANRTKMVMLIDDFERLGLAERRRDDDDRRVYYIHLTPAGSECVKRALAQQRAVEARWLAPFSEAERTTLRSLLGRLAPQTINERGPSAS